MTDPSDEYSRFAPDGSEWWKLKTTPGGRRPFGGEKRIAAWLWFNAEVSETFTMRQLRQSLGDGDGEAENAEQLNRRLRALRPDDWVITSYKDDRTLPPDTYRLDKKGVKIWLDKRTGKAAVSQRTRRLVMERDGSRCKICGVGDGEPYPDEPTTKAKLTIGHRIPEARGGSREEGNLRTECARCNEPVRHEAIDPETYDEVFAEVRTLRSSDIRSLLTWLQSGERTRSKLDKAHDRARKLSSHEIDRLIIELHRMLGN
ncbi:HNH endonuclease [Streptosporangium lutulentum]|uniref:HNH domain-containing protein n=1 Tax=Streptosporangium lutulentum TaxID=1461250 RepID=A0ABT9QPG2_9ACTN|nr:HNH endonuclease [Streptosporangium lutulentum]MDP9848650.1 hypothetical protein [Streptosporangium lutulentum]